MHAYLRLEVLVSFSIFQARRITTLLSLSVYPFSSYFYALSGTHIDFLHIFLKS